MWQQGILQTSFRAIWIDFQVKLNRGLDFVNLDEVLVDLKLTPDVVEIPVPAYFKGDRGQVSHVFPLSS